MRLPRETRPPRADADRVEDKVASRVALVALVAPVEDSSPTRAASLDARDAAVALDANIKCFAPKNVVLPQNQYE